MWPTLATCFCMRRMPSECDEAGSAGQCASRRQLQNYDLAIHAMSSSRPTYRMLSFFISNDHRRFCRVLDAVVASAPAPLADVRFAGITANTPSVSSALGLIVDTWRGSLAGKYTGEDLTIQR